MSEHAFQPQGTPDRRNFLKTVALGSLSFILPSSLMPLFGNSLSPIRFGLITDLHKDIIHDAEDRLATFLEQMEQENPHALIQMGDFAIPSKKNMDFIAKYSKSHPLALHVLGNHDMDEGYTKATVVNAYGMPAPYYSLSVQGVRVIVLDGNEEGSPTYTSGYPSYIGGQQQAWLKDQLESSHEPILLVSHQPLAGIYTLDNAQEIRALLQPFASKIIAAINGHAHVDQMIYEEGIHYLHLNSASYYWVGQKHSHLSLSPDIHDHFPSLSLTCPYRDPLFALLSIDPQQRTLTLTGRQTEWIGPSPAQLGYSILTKEEQEHYLQPKISRRTI